MHNSRIFHSLSNIKKNKSAALGIFITAGDPNILTSQKILNALPSAGADFIELGMPFSDPMADGPAIQESSLRALKSGIKLKQIIEMVKVFRTKNNTTPIILMGYFNPIYSYGVDKFLKDTKNAGVDGFIIVDLPFEEDEEFCIPSIKNNLDYIRLVTPTSDRLRLKKILHNAKGFIYYVSVTGITGTKKGSFDQINKSVRKIKTLTDLPVAVGFGIRSKGQVNEISKIADAIIIGSYIVNIIKKNYKYTSKLQNNVVSSVISEVKKFSAVLNYNLRK